MGRYTLMALACAVVAFLWAWTGPWHAALGWLAAGVAYAQLAAAKEQN